MGNRASLLWLELSNAIESLTWVVVVLSILVYTKNDRWVIGLTLFLPIFFNDLLILIDPDGFNNWFKGIVSTVIVLALGFIKSPVKWQSYS